MVIPSIDGAHLSILRRFWLIASGIPKLGIFPDNGLHECNTWLYDALVCHAYAALFSDPTWRGLPDNRRFDDLRNLVRQFISDANPSGFSREIQYWIAELTWAHLRDNGFPYVTAQTAHDGHHPQPELCALFAHYIIGHSFAHGGAEICASDNRRAQECTDIVRAVNSTGFALVRRSGNWEKRDLMLLQNQKFSAR